MNKRSILSLKGGFTLIEIMVAMTIFSLVMVIGIGALFTSSASAKKSKSLNTVMDNLNFAMENMTRSLRLGSNYYCNRTIPISVAPNVYGEDCSNGGESISFMSADEDLEIDTTFKLSDPDLNGRRSIQKVFSDGMIPYTTNLTAPEVDIEELKFFVKGTDINDQIQPSVYVIVKGKVTIKKEITNFAIQTLVSQRNAE